jgi:hypothetical protein
LPENGDKQYSVQAATKLIVKKEIAKRIKLQKLITPDFANSHHVD